MRQIMIWSVKNNLHTPHAMLNLFMPHKNEQSNPKNDIQNLRTIINVF